MMNNLKTGIKIMRHAYGLKSNAIQAAVFALAGLLYAFTEERSNFGVVGGFFWVCIAILPTQLIQSLNVANLVQSSPLKKRMQTSIPVTVNLASMTVVYLLEILLCGLRAWANPEQAAQMGGSLVSLTVMMALVLIYLGVCYKYFVVATFCLVSIMVIWMQGSLDSWMQAGNLFAGWNIPFGQAVLMGFGILAAGGLAEYLLTLLLYKRPMSKMAQAVPLRKEL